MIKRRRNWTGRSVIRITRDGCGLSVLRWWAHGSQWYQT